MDILLISVNVALMIFFIAMLVFMQIKHVSFSKRVFAGLGIGVLFGTFLQLTYETSNDILKNTSDWFSLVGSGYVKVLQMIIIPLIMVSIISAIINLANTKSLGKISGLIIGILLFTTAISAGIGIATSLGFNLTAVEIQQGKVEQTRGEYMTNKLTDVNKVSPPQRLLEVIPSNPFADMTGSRSSSTLAVVIFSSFVGVAALGIKKKRVDQFETFKKVVDAAYAVTMRLVQIILRLTPYGVLAIMTNAIANTSFESIVKLIKFVAASYVALIAVLIIHLILISIFKLHPLLYLKKILPVLSFAFSSRSSASTLPLTIEAETKKLGMEEGIANFAATFGTSIGQNGCAGIYPAMLAIMIAPTVGINPANPSFIATLIIVVTLSSFGIAGVGGGATFASLIVLSSMGLPVGLAGLLISIEPLIDMGRTAVNVSGSVTAGLITSKILKQIDLNVYNNSDIDTDKSLAQNTSSLTN
jgi:uncharacterized protein